ncbi:MAG TPA: rhomboid family intramembrane serine protease [Candidatus Angelobacter sp.]|nr:rhomboid family intramembrane serine protease [Candidatus Angelobacter sp.]
MSTPAKFSEPEVPPVSSGSQESSEPFQSATPDTERFSATAILIAANILVFLAMQVHSIYITGAEKFLDTRIGAAFDSALLQRWGSDFSPLTLGGQFWRVITSVFLHSNIVHLGVNMLFLWRLGIQLDRLFDRAQIFAIYLLTGAASSLLSLAWNPIRNSVGFSGAIYGQAGVLIALLAFARLNLPRRNLVNILVWVLLLTPFDLLWGHLSKTTDYAAHVGGLMSGLVIGALLARTFRKSRTERTHLQRRLLLFVTAALVFMFAAVTQLRSDVVKQYRAEAVTTSEWVTSRGNKTRVARVFINLSGNPTLVQRLSSFLKLELEDAGIIVTNTQAEADAVISGEVNAQIQQVNGGFGVIRMQITVNGNVEKIGFCASLSTVDYGDFFNLSAGDVAGRVRQKYPNARTVKIDSASDMALSNKLGVELPVELKASGFSISESGSADLILRIDLAQQKVPVEENTAKYKVRVVTHNGTQLSSESGSGVLFAKLAAAAPAVCPDRFTDLEWLYSNDPLFAVASRFARDLQSANAKLSVGGQTSEPESHRVQIDKVRPAERKSPDGPSH